MIDFSFYVINNKQDMIKQLLIGYIGENMAF